MNQKWEINKVSTPERIFDKNSRSIQQVEALEQSPPTADGLDYLIVVEGKKEG